MSKEKRRATKTATISPSELARWAKRFCEDHVGKILEVECLVAQSSINDNYVVETIRFDPPAIMRVVSYEENDLKELTTKGISKCDVAFYLQPVKPYERLRGLEILSVQGVWLGDDDIVNGPAEEYPLESKWKATDNQEEHAASPQTITPSCSMCGRTFSRVISECRAIIVDHICETINGCIFTEDADQDPAKVKSILRGPSFYCKHCNHEEPIPEHEFWGPLKKISIDDFLEEHGDDFQKRK